MCAEGSLGVCCRNVRGVLKEVSECAEGKFRSVLKEMLEMCWRKF